MSDSEDRTTGSKRGKVWEYLRRRSELDQEIQSRFSRPVTVMFTDIRGSTTFFERRGDIEGITMLQRHDERVLPPIQNAEGRIVKRLGDGLMVTFPTAASAVRAAIEIERSLAEFNQGRPDGEQINLRIGINTGVGIVEEDDVFGDVVNAAARVQALAEPGQVLVTESVYREASPNLGTALFVPVGPASLKGKERDVVLYELVWSPDGGRRHQLMRRAAEGRRRVFVLEVLRHAGRLKVSGHEQLEGEEQTLRAYEELPWDEGAVTQAVDRIGTILEAGDREGSISNRELDELIRLGQLLYERLVPAQIRNHLIQTAAAELMLVLDDQLVQIPWELLHDGNDFLCLRFGVGRVVRTAQPVAGGQPGELRRSLRVVIVADPQGDLPDARREGIQLKAQLGIRPEFEVVLPEMAIDRERFVGYFSECDVLHFAGHAEYDPANPSASSFVLADGALPAAELLPLTASPRVPRLAFLNACQSGRTPRWRPSQLATGVFGLANAVLLSGVKHYVGVLRPIQDRAGLDHALEFYRQLETGQSVGVALREARRALAKRQGKTSLTWASYVLYGDPTSRYLPRAEMPSSPWFGRRARLAVAGVTAAVGLIGAGLFVIGLPSRHAGESLDGAYQKLESGQFEEAKRDFQALVRTRPAAAYAGLAAVALQQGQLTRAEALCREALGLDSRQAICQLVQGDLHLLQGDPDGARPLYEAAVRPETPVAQQAFAYNRLGRLAAERGQADQAAAAYARAQQLDPRNWESLSNLGALLQREGRYAEARGVLESAGALRPHDALIQTLLGQSREAEALARDRERQRRLDELVDDLAQRYKRGDLVRPPGVRDDWTSRPLTLCVLGLESRGRVPFREGEHEFVLLRLGQVLEGQGRARLVDRTMTDKLLSELKLATSALVDPTTALRLGRLLSARFITTGSIASTGGEWQLTVRVIETETSGVVASVGHASPVSRSTADAVEQAGREISEKLLRAFPLRGRVVEVGKDEVRLNIGGAEGAAPGLRLQLLSEGRGQRAVVGEVEVVEVGERSRARVLSAQVPLAVGLKVLEAR